MASVSQSNPETRVTAWVNRPEVVELEFRRYRVRDLRIVRSRQIAWWAGVALVLVAIVVFAVGGQRLLQSSLEAAAVVSLGVLGAVMALRVPRRPVSHTLLDLDMSNRILAFPVTVTNGSGSGTHEVSVDDIDVLLFGLRQAPVQPDDPGSVEVNAFALYLRTLDGTLLPIIPACRDQGRTFAVAQFLRDMLDVLLKQVGRGWRD